MFMNDPENHAEKEYDTPRVKAILDELDQFKYGADTFVMVRNVDHNGQSGTGIVADGVIFPDGRVSMRWRSDGTGANQTEHWDELHHARSRHGHGGDTTFEVVPVSEIVDAVRFALMVPGMGEDQEDPVQAAFAAGWNACRRQVESAIDGGLHPKKWPTG
jgi:hypothetical protein